MVLYLRDRNAKVVQLLESLDTENFRQITSTASNFNLRCLPYVDFIGDTIFNHKQLLELIKEITLLKNQETVIHGKELNVLETAALAALENPDYYLLINGK
jgi:hypothetical protein